MSELIWQTERVWDGPEFKILLDRDFAIKMADCKISTEKERRMQELGSREIKGIGMEPYLFHNGSCLVDQINLGMDGKWLATNNQEMRKLEERRRGRRYHGAIVYNSHNLMARSDAHKLISLFDIWVHYSGQLTDKEE